MPTRTLIVATAGHVDHGKTSLVNRITGVDTDTLAEEKRRGLTINLGYAYHHFETDIDGAACSCTLGFVDVPGHIDFINNMLAGIGGVDFALLVVAADDGIMPQTREHLAIIKLLGISRGLVALTKTDRVEAQRVAEVRAELAALLAGSPLAAAPVIPVSNQTGAGIDELIRHLSHAVIQAGPENRTGAEGKLRFLVDRAFSVKGIGTVVTGAVRAGSAHAGIEAVNTGNGKAVRLRGLRLDEQAIESAGAGQRAAINIDAPLEQVTRGDWLVAPDIYRPVMRFDATLELLDRQTILRPGAQYHLFLGASHHIVKLRRLDVKIDAKVDARIDAKDGQFIQVSSAGAMFAHHGDRFIIRDPASEHTLGGGRVVDIFVPRRKRSSEARLAQLQALCADHQTALTALLEQCPEGVNLARFAINRNITGKYLNTLTASLQQDDAALLQTPQGKVLLHEKYTAQYRAQILAQVEQFHGDQPAQQGISEPALSRAVDFSGSHFLFHALLQNLVDENGLKRSGTVVHAPGHRAVLSREEQEFLDRIRPLLVKAGKIPPRTRELVELSGIPLKRLESILAHTTKAGSLIRVADNRHYLPETIMELAEFTEQLAAAGPEDTGFSVIQFRDASGIGRNLCIEILEYFDRVGFTRRDGNTRFLRTGKDNVFGA